MQKNLRFLSLIVFAAVMLVPLLANAQPKIEWPFAFADRFPGNAKPSGFTKGIKLTMGADISPGPDGCPIDFATATNGVVDYELTQTALPPFAPKNYQIIPVPLFDPEIHLGVWEIHAVDDCGNEAYAWTPVLHAEHVEEVMPYVKNLQASGDPHTPTITWKPPKDAHIPDFCDRLRANLRLLTAPDNQFYRSGSFWGQVPEYTDTIPEGFLTTELIPDTWVRIEFRCYDVDGLELRSNTFRPLQDLLEGANGL